MSRVVVSIPHRGENEATETYHRIGEFAEQVVIPLLMREAESIRGGENGDSDLALAALETINAIGHLGPRAIGTMPLAALQIFELKYAEALARRNGMTVNPENALVLHSGSGARIPEVWGEMGFGTDYVTEQQLQELGDTIVFGQLPKQMHCAEPDPELSMATIENSLPGLLPPYDSVDLSSSHNFGETGLVMSNNTHFDVIRDYRPKTVDKLVVLRLDPSTLIQEGMLGFGQRPEEKIEAFTEAGETFFKLLRILKPKGHALITVGAGNNAAETAVRKGFLTGMRECLKDRGIPHVEFYNPFAEIINRHASLYTPQQRIEILDDLLPMASIQGLIVAQSYRADNLIEEFGKRNTLPTALPSARRSLGPSITTGRGSGWARQRIVSGVEIARDTYWLGTGRTEDEVKA